MIAALALSALLGTARADVNDATSQLQSNCVNGDASACTMLAVRLRRAEGLLRDACDLNDAAACLEIGRDLDSWGVERDRTAALEARERGCEAGSAPLCLAAGLARLQLFGEVDRDPEKGLNQLTSACVFGDNAACDLSESLEPVNLTINPKGYWFDGRAAGALQPATDGALRPRATDARGGVVLPLKAALEPRSRALQERLLAAGASPARVPGMLRVVVEPGVPWSAVEPGLRTAALLGFRDARLTLRDPAGDRVVQVVLPTPAPLPNEPDGADLAAVVRATLEDQAPAFQRCYETSLARRPKLAGRVIIDVTVGSDGFVTEALPGANTLQDADAVGCLVERVRGLKLPVMADKEPYTVSLPFNFTP